MVHLLKPALEFGNSFRQFILDQVSDLLHLLRALRFESILPFQEFCEEIRVAWGPSSDLFYNLIG